MRLRDHLKNIGLSAAEGRRAMSNGKIFVDGYPSADGGQEVLPTQCEFRPEAPKITPGLDLFIVHRDDDVVVVWKPPGMLSVPARKAGGHKNVVGLVRKLTGAAFTVHRIDQPTSGLMMVARNVAAQENLKAQLEVHTVERRYLALIKGRSKTDIWTIDNHLARDRGDGLRGQARTPTSDTKHAITHFRALHRAAPGITLVEAKLETGRTHQVRIHLAENRLAILGDTLYAPNAVARLSPRLALHAAVLGFRHPRTKQPMRFEAPLADDLNQLIRSLSSLQPATSTQRRPHKNKGKQRHKRKGKGKGKGKSKSKR
jgi:23S rRNA pseudouridine1911/1915/1917 synthase